MAARRTQLHVHLDTMKLSNHGWVVLAMLLLDHRGRRVLLRMLLERLLLPSGQVCPGSSASGEGLETGGGSRLYLGPSQALCGPSGSEHPQACLYPDGRNDLLFANELLCSIGNEQICTIRIVSPGVWQAGDVDGVEARSGLRLLLFEEKGHPSWHTCALALSCSMFAQPGTFTGPSSSSRACVTELKQWRGMA